MRNFQKKLKLREKKESSVWGPVTLNSLYPADSAEFESETVFLVNVFFLCFWVDFNPVSYVWTTKKIISRPQAFKTFRIIHARQVVKVIC